MTSDHEHLLAKVPPGFHVRIVPRAGMCGSIRHYSGGECVSVVTFVTVEHLRTGRQFVELARLSGLALLGPGDERRAE